MSPTTTAGMPGGAGQPQVDEVAVEEVDLGRAARPFDEHDVEAGPEAVERGEHGARRPGLAAW